MGVDPISRRHRFGNRDTVVGLGTGRPRTCSRVAMHKNGGSVGDRIPEPSGAGFGAQRHPAPPGAWRQVRGVLKGCEHLETPDAESRPTHARRATADRRSKRSPPRHPARPEPVAPAAGPAGRGRPRGRGARDAAGVVVRSRAVQVRPGGDHRVPGHHLRGPARLRLVAVHPAGLAPRLRRARGALHRGARAGAAGDGAERGRGESEGRARAGGGSLARARAPADRVGVCGRSATSTWAVTSRRTGCGARQGC